MVKKYVDRKISIYSAILGIDLPYFISGGFWSITAAIVTALAGILLSSLFARVWPKDAYGEFSFLMSMIALLSLTALPGMARAVIQSVSEEKEGTYRVALGIMRRWSIIGAVVLLGGSIYFFARENADLGLAVLLSVLVFPISASGILYRAYYTGKRQFKKLAIFGTLAQLFSISLTAFALFQLPSLAMVTLFSTWSMAIANLFFTNVSLSEVKNKLVDKKLLQVGKHISYADLIAVGADYLDRFLVPLLLGFSNNAIYAFATLIPIQIHGFLKTFLNLGQPKIAKIDNKRLGSELIKKGFRFELLLIVIVVGYILTAPFIFDFLYPAYKETSLRFSQLFSLSLLYFPGHLFGLGIIRKRGIRQMYYANAIFTISSAVALLVLIPIYGLLGAIIAKLIIRSIQVCTQVFFFFQLK